MRNMTSHLCQNDFHYTILLLFYTNNLHSCPAAALSLELSPVVLIDHDVSVLDTLVDKLRHDLVQILHGVSVDPRLDVVLGSEFEHLGNVGSGRSYG